MSSIAGDESPVANGEGTRTVAGVLSRLRELILSQELGPGEPIRQEEMARTLGISRVPLREALRVLTTEGLLTHRPNQGYVVTKLSTGDLEQILSLLEFFETELLRTARWPTEAEIAVLRGLNAEFSAAAAQRDFGRASRVNGELHLSVFRLSPLDLYMGEVERFWARSEPYQRLRLTATDHTVAVDQHEQIIDALAAHDRPLTLRMSAVHRRDSTNASLRVLDGMGDVRS